MDNREPDPKPADAKWPLWLTKHQAAARLGKSVAVIKKLQARGYLHAVLRNGISLFALTEVEALARPGRRPSPWLATPSKSRRKIAPMAGRSEGQEAAMVFRLIDQGMTLREIVMRARVPPHRVRALYREWARSLDDGAPRDEHTLGDGAELDALAAAAEDLFERKA